MFRSTTLFFSTITSLLTLSACYSPKFMVDDDVYVIKSNEIPVGESINDETSYANYKARRNGTALSSGFYDDDPLFWSRHRFHNDVWWLGMGFGNPYYNQFSYRPGYWGIPFYSPYMYGTVNPIYMYDPFGYPYGFYPTAYDPWYFGGMYGYPNYWYGPGYISNSSGTGVLSNHHSGPRGSIGGFGDPNRVQGSVLKSAVISGNNTGSNQLQQQFRLDQHQVIGQHMDRPTNGINDRSNIGSRELRPTVNRGIAQPGSLHPDDIRTRQDAGRPGHPVNRSTPPSRITHPSGRNGSMTPGGNRPANPGNRGTGAPVRRN